MFQSNQNKKKREKKDVERQQAFLRGEHTQHTDTMVDWIRLAERVQSEADTQIIKLKQEEKRKSCFVCPEMSPRQNKTMTKRSTNDSR